MAKKWLVLAVCPGVRDASRVAGAGKLCGLCRTIAVRLPCRWLFTGEFLPSRWGSRIRALVALLIRFVFESSTLPRAGCYLLVFCWRPVGLLWRGLKLSTAF